MKAMLIEILLPSGKKCVHLYTNISLIEYFYSKDMRIYVVCAVYSQETPTLVRHVCAEYQKVN